MFQSIPEALGIILLAVIVLVIIIVKIIEWYEKRKQRILGYRVEFISENVLRGEPDTFAIVYYQGGFEEWFYGKIINNEFILNLDIEEGTGSKQGIDIDLMRQRILSQIKKYRIKIKP